MATEHRALRLELAAKLEEIVDLTVEHDHVAAVRRQHGLIAAVAGIDDGQAAVAECEASVCAEPGPLAERTAMRDQAGQPRDVGRFDRVAT
ncbi:hypothetical protein ACVWYI_006153 [Bradyrhizobium sp. LB13.1]